MNAPSTMPRSAPAAPPSLDLAACEAALSPFPAPEGVTLRVFRLDACRARLPSLLATLDAADRARFGEISAPGRALAFAAGRACVRTMLSDAVGGAPQMWRIAVDPSGKPSAAEAPDFSLSYTDRFCAVAIAMRGAIGVDLEPLDSATRLGPPWPGLSAEERRLIDATPAETRPDAYLAAWTAKEATAKCMGSGSAFDFERIDASFALRGETASRSGAVAIRTVAVTLASARCVLSLALA